MTERGYRMHGLSMLAAVLALVSGCQAPVTDQPSAASVRVESMSDDGTVVLTIRGLPPSTRCLAVAIDADGHFVEVGPRLVTSKEGSGQLTYRVSESRPDLVSTVADIEVTCGEETVDADVSFPKPPSATEGTTTTSTNQPTTTSTTLPTTTATTATDSPSGEISPTIDTVALSATEVISIGGTLAAPELSAIDLSEPLPGSGFVVRGNAPTLEVIVPGDNGYLELTVDVASGAVHQSSPNAEATVLVANGAALVQRIEGGGVQLGVANGTDEVVWLDDPDLIPLTKTPDGVFLVATGIGGLATVSAHGTVSPYQLPVELPTAWSAAFGPDEKLALGLSTNEVVLISGSDLAILDGLPVDGSPIDIAWTDDGAGLLVNVSAATVNDSGIYGCDISMRTPCRKVVDWSPDLRLAHH